MAANVAALAGQEAYVVCTIEAVWLGTEGDGLARRLVGDDAEDAVQDCLLKAFRALDGLADEGASRSWVTAIPKFSFIPPHGPAE